MVHAVIQRPRLIKALSSSILSSKDQVEEMRSSGGSYGPGLNVSFVLSPLRWTELRLGTVALIGEPLSRNSSAPWKEHKLQ